LGEAEVASGAEREPERYRIVRHGRGWDLVGRHVFVWEPTFREAAGWEDELEPGCHHHFLPPGRRSQPYLGIAYGPVASRRLGRSLGVNLSPPGRIVCSFRCAYCEFDREDGERGGSGWPAAARVAEEVAEALERGGELDSLTISGHGEPTLHPCFPEVTRALLAAARRVRPGLPVRVLTSGAGALRPGVCAALDALDERIVKLDAAPERVNRPAQPLGALLYAVSRLRDLTAQSCFVEGVVCNTDEAAIRDWLDLLGELHLRAVHVYTIHHPPARGEVHPVPRAHLEAIAERVRRRTGAPTGVYA
jgi:wyosine [tRNA(Phe)-imidazoG37] synthetase (radical SAM superfamily)